jgi:hypothetical protein
MPSQAGFLEVWPFTQGELVGVIDDFIDRSFTEVAALAEYRPSEAAQHALS